MVDPERLAKIEVKSEEVDNRVQNNENQIKEIDTTLLKARVYIKLLALY